MFETQTQLARYVANIAYKYEGYPVAWAFFIAAVKFEVS